MRRHLLCILAPSAARSTENPRAGACELFDAGGGTLPQRRAVSQQPARCWRHTVRTRPLQPACFTSTIIIIIYSLSLILFLILSLSSSLDQLHFSLFANNTATIICIINNKFKNSFIFYGLNGVTLSYFCLLSTMYVILYSGCHTPINSIVLINNYS